jgi:hypothetical protein
MIQGLKQFPPVLGHHGEMLAEILAAVSDREAGEDSPLVSALRDLVLVIKSQGERLDRIERHLREMPAAIVRAGSTGEVA